MQEADQIILCCNAETPFSIGVRDYCKGIFVEEFSYSFRIDSCQCMERDIKNSRMLTEIREAGFRRDDLVFRGSTGLSEREHAFLHRIDEIDRSML